VSAAAAGEPVGGPAQEARRLVEALSEWASNRLGSPECQICPVCQVISALRGDRPEVLARLGDAWTAFLGVLTDPAREQTASTPSEAARRAAPGVPSGAGADPMAPVRPVQNIDVR
jgi:hypothetical protein